MFYSQQLQIIDTNSSYLNPSQIFCGNYWDEFGLTPYFIPDGARVLMLGLGSGGGIRPIFSTKKKLTLTCVDIDTDKATQCQNFFQKQFKELKFEMKIEDAEKFLTQSDQKFHLIWLDIYEHDRYSPLYFKPEFQKLLQSRLEKDGVLLVNAFGIPNQFRPLEIDSAQRDLVYLLQQYYSFVGHTLFRRNQTIVASSRRPDVKPAAPHSDLHSIDKMSAIVQFLRAKNCLECVNIFEKTQQVEEEQKFEKIDAHMLSGWQQILESLKEYGLLFDKPRELLALIQNSEIGTRYLDQALARADCSIHFVPILAAGESFVQKLAVDWLFNWTYENVDELIRVYPVESRQLWLTQLWALVIHPSKTYRLHCFRLFKLIQDKFQ